MTTDTEGLTGREVAPSPGRQALHLPLRAENGLAGIENFDRIFPDGARRGPLDSEPVFFENNPLITPGAELWFAETSYDPPNPNIRRDCFRDELQGPFRTEGEAWERVIGHLRWKKTDFAGAAVLYHIGADGTYNELYREPVTDDDRL